ncbi:hypothetical protein CTEN210_00416 [Chaetoceros tenuissimus]|uniref:PNPLA domain-containing protein n=1 Tax=Chaetoceros tenuissimus TaxID=426638 RepID=A0AAD3CD56_9STRA|nr:hypothetical protein CTEN210_00416 [Chaetoceros tenuissimus]
MPSYEKKESFEHKRKRLASVKVWVKNFMDADQKNKNILETFEKNAELDLANTINTNDIDPNAKPINILVVEGGGMKGYAAIATVEAIQDNYLEKDQDFFGQFDLIAGTSVGGMSALLVSHYWSLGCTTDEVISKGRDVMDDIRDNGFSKINFGNLLCCNQLIEKKNSKERDEETLEEIEDREIEPLIGRTYEYPNAPIDEDVPKLAHSSSGMKMYEAMAATGSPPVLVDRVRAKVDEKMRIMADGGLFQNCPLALAIDEASRLYPGRPIGVIVDLGYTDNEELFVHRTLETARLKHRDMHFQRFAANDIMKDFSAIETNIHTIAEMEENVKEYVINTPRVRNTTFETMRRLFASEPRSFSNVEKDDHRATAGKIMSDLGKSVAFQRRQRMRASVAHNHLHPQSRFDFAKSILGLQTITEPQTINSTDEEEQSSSFFPRDDESTIHEKFTEEWDC